MAHLQVWQGRPCESPALSGALALSAIIVWFCDFTCHTHATMYLYQQMPIQSMYLRLLTIPCLFLAFCSFAQLEDGQLRQIDELFESWNTPNHPGGSVGVMKDGEVVFSRAYGLASLEYLVPNTTGTIYNTASVSKQFTAMGIVRLEEMGLLSVDDDIR